MSIADRGFASMSPKKRREISVKGGIASGKARAKRPTPIKKGSK
jgi:hypothetical protein